MNRILEQVQNGDFDPVKMFTGNKDKFSEVKTAIESISNNLPKEVCIQFILTKIIPTVFDKNVDNRIRDEAVEVGLHFLQFVNVSTLSTKDQEDVFTAIEERYTKTTGELRDSNYSNWDKLWIFLVKLCSHALHTKLSLANKLLRTVEVAFRNSTSIEQRLKAYDCWVELINNSSMKMEHMCSPKQIKLLVTPLKAKFSRTPVVIMKRCDTFVYLLGKMQDKATLCLKEFLEFCFGPFDEKNNTEKMKQGRSVPEVCNKSTKVLLEILDHSHGDLEKCLKSDDLQLYKPLINDINFPNFADILINSVMECCILLNEWSQDSSINNIIIKCLWRSLLCLVQRSSEDVKKKCCTRIYNSLQKLLEGSREHEYLHLILANVMDLLIQDEISKNLKEILFDVGFNLLCSSATEALNVEKTAGFIISCFDTENISKFDKAASKYFKNNTKCENSALCDIWLKCNVIDIANLIWPVHHYQHFKDVEALNAKWTKLYSSEYKTEGMKFTVMQEVEKLFLDNPLLSSNIIHFLELMSLAETIPSKDFVAKFMRLIELVLTLPNLSDSNIKQLSSIVMRYSDQSQNFYKTENNDEALDKVCGCLEHLVTIHKDYTVLTELYTNLKNTQPKNLVKFSKRLLSCLESLMLNEDMSIVNKTRKIIELLETKENEPETITLATSRSLRIVNMVNVTPKPKRASGQMNNLKLFGKDVNKTTPLILKGSKTYGKARINDSKNKKDSVASINDDKSSDYVKIDTEVKINLDNLSEHQKEMLKKRREDIPALYQDLTQSQSQDFFKSADRVETSEEKIDHLPTDQSKKEENNKEELNSVDDEQASKKDMIENDDVSEEKISDSLVGQSEKEEVNEKKSPPSKKRKRDENHVDEQISKVPKLLEETTSNNRLEELVTVTNVNDETKTQILEMATEESDQRSLDEEVARINVMEIDESFDVNINSSDGTEIKIYGETENDETQILDESHPSDENKTVEKTDENKTVEKTDEDKTVEKTVEDKTVEKTEEQLDETKISPRSRLRRAEKKKTDDNSDRTLRKSKRNSGAQQLRDELVKVVQKQLETYTDEQNESTNEKLSETNEENNLENDEEVGDEDKEQETSLRKSKRQVKKRQSDYIVNASRKKKSETDNVKINDLHSSEEFQDTKKNVVKGRRRSGDLNSSRRNKDKQNQSRNKVANDGEDAQESMADLLARVDKRIEENKRLELEKQAKEELQDGNQNEIISATESSPEVKDAEVENLKEPEDAEVNTEKAFVKGKRRIKPSVKPLTIDSTTDVQLPSTKRGDVYEFKADDESSQSESVKRSRKRRKTMFFNRSDYISKRRKKPKKETKDEGFPFHVTADSPLPLSKSQSLRAVPSHESETITIVITRSPVEKENKSSLEISDSSPTTNDVILASPKKKNKRKNSTEVPNSDDIIESSQVTPVDTSKRRSSSSRNKTRALKQTTIEEMMKPQIYTSGRRRTRSCGPTEEDSLSPAATLTLESSKELIPANVPITKPRRLSLSELSTQEVTLGKRNKRSKSLDKLDPMAEPISFVLKPKFSEMVKNVTLICETAVTNSEQETLITDTEIIEQADTLTLSPVKSQSPDLPGSPMITKEDLPGSPVTCDTPDRTTELLNNTFDISPISSVQESVTPKPAAGEVSNVRVARLLKMVNSNLTVGNEKSKWYGNKHSSPSSSKVRKMRLKKEENLDLLTFSREIPSPLTVPASGILKRKFHNLEEPAAPPPKRKRVNFSDPAISEKKIFIKDSEEYSDPDQTTESTSEYHLRSYELRDFKKKVANKKSDGLSSAPDREDMLLSFKDFCDSNFKDVAVDCSDLKSALKTLIRNLKVPEVVEIVSEFLVDSNSETVDDINDELKSGTSQEVTDKCAQIEEFLPKLIDVVKKLPDEKLEHFINEIARVFGESRTNKELTRRQIKDHIVKLDCDAMNDLIKEYFLTLQDQKRNDFLVSLMSLASSELPAKKEFVNCHFRILQNFVNKMTD